MYHNPFDSIVMVYFFDKLRELRAKRNGEQIVVRLPAGATKTIRVRIGERFITIGRYLAPPPELPIMPLPEPVLGKQQV